MSQLCSTTPTPLPHTHIQTHTLHTCTHNARMHTLGLCRYHILHQIYRYPIYSISKTGFQINWYLIHSRFCAPSMTLCFLLLLVRTYINNTNIHVTHFNLIHIHSIQCKTYAVHNHITLYHHHNWSFTCPSKIHPQNEHSHHTWYSVWLTVYTILTISYTFHWIVGYVCTR